MKKILCLVLAFAMALSLAACGGNTEPETPEVPAFELTGTLEEIADKIYANETITDEIADKALKCLDIDGLGLDNTDIKMLDAIINKFAGGPVGVETLAATIGEDANTIEDVYEPYLMQIGFVNRTPRGRTATKLAYEHLGIEFDN